MHERVVKAIEDIRSGKMVVMTDDESRENEGDIVFAASFCTTEKVNFVITHAKGILCTPLTKELARKFALAPMIDSNTSNHETAFTVSIDAKEAATGVSAVERDMTIKKLVDYNTLPSDFVRPGHIFPLIAKSGGVLERTGHTEGSIDLCRLAGVAPVAVICEIVKENGEMARKADLEAFCERFGLNMVSVSDIIRYRLENEKLIRIESRNNALFCGKKCTKFEISDHTGVVHNVFKFGEFSSKCTVKFAKFTNVLELLTNERFEEFLADISTLERDGGMLVCISGGKFEEIEVKNYGIGVQILREFGVTEAKLLSKSTRDFVAIEAFGVKLTRSK